MRTALARPTIQLAIVLVALAAGAFGAWRAADVDALDAWMPNIVTGLVFLAATITVVEWIVRREATLRLGPRLERLRSGLRGNLEVFCEVVAIDYTHRGGRAPVPRDMLEFLDSWLADEQRPETDPNAGISTVIRIGLELETALRTYRGEDREIMEPALVRAIDDFVADVAASHVLLSLLTNSPTHHDPSDLGPALPRGTRRPAETRLLIDRASSTFVAAARAFGAALVELHGEPFEFSEGALATVPDSADPQYA